MAAQITSLQIDNFRANIANQASQAIEAVKNALNGRTGTAKELSAIASSVLRSNLPYFADNAQIISQMVFDEITYMAGYNVKVTFYDNLINWGYINAKIKQLAQQYADENIEQFYEQLYYLTADEVWKSAQRGMSRNCSDNGMKFQIIASPDACLFCTAMASKGAAHWDEEGYADDGFFHDHCNCMPVPEGADYLGNSPDDYYDDYSRRAKELLENRKDGLARGDGRFSDKTHTIF